MGMSHLILVFILCMLSECSCFVPISGNDRSKVLGCRFRSIQRTVLHASSSPSPSPLSSSFGVLQFFNSQKFTYIAGGLGLTTVLLNRLAILDSSVSDFQSRLDLIATMAASALLLNALTQQEIETKERDSVSLVGYSCTSTIINTNLDASSSQSESKSNEFLFLLIWTHLTFFETFLGKSYSWLCDTILEGVSGVTSVHLIDVNAGVVLARRGVVGNGDDRQKGTHFY